MLKIKCLALAATSMLVITTASANAQDGTINFTGEIVSNTCTIANNGDVTVDLPRIAIVDFADAPEGRVGERAFDIELSDCTPASGTVAVRFIGNGTQIDTETGLFKNNSAAANAATNVSVAVYDSADTLIKAAGNSSTPVNVAAAGTATISLTAWYQRAADVAGTAPTITSGPLTATGGIELVYN